MASNKRSSRSPIPPPTQPESDARQRLLQALAAMTATLNAEIFRLETTGNMSGRHIDKVYKRLAWAVDSHWEEQQLELPVSQFVLEAKRNYIRGFHGEVAR